MWGFGDLGGWRVSWLWRGGSLLLHVGGGLVFSGKLGFGGFSDGVGRCIFRLREWDGRNEADLGFGVVGICYMGVGIWVVLV